jgi:hypothetical protein
MICDNMGRDRDASVIVIIILIQNWTLVRPTIFHPFPQWIIVLIE